MKTSEDKHTYKPGIARVVIENVIGYVVSFILICVSNGKIGIPQLSGAFLVFILAFIHNTFVLKPALQKQEWLWYVIKLVVCLFVLFPCILFIDDIVQHYVDKTPIPEISSNFYKAQVVGSVVFVFLGSSAYLFKYFGIERQQRLRSDLKLMEKQLLLLQSQFNPHFLFNALNSIKSLTSSDPEKAKDAIVLLSELLRKSLNISTDSFIKIDEEIATVNEYLVLEKLRYGSRLEFNVNIADNLKKCLIPAMCLQLMVENAIKHGISKLIVGGHINIDIYEKEKMLYIDVRNPGQLILRKPETGIGTQNIIENLKLLYGDSGRFSIVNENEKTVLARVIIPVKHNL